MSSITEKTIFERILSFIGFSKIEEYYEDIGFKQKRILNEFSSTREDIQKIYSEITGKQIKEEHKIHVLVDILRFFKEIIPCLNTIESIPEKYKKEEDPLKKEKLLKLAKKEYESIQINVNKIKAHLLDFKHPNTNLGGYKAVFDMWRFIDKRLKSPEIENILGVSKNIKYFEDQLDLLKEDLLHYKDNENKILQLDNAFIHIIIHLRKEFIELRKDYTKISNSTITHDEIKIFSTRIHKLQKYLDILRVQEEELFTKSDKFENPFEAEHKKIALHYIALLEGDVKRLINKLSRFINENLDYKKFKNFKVA